MRFDCQDLGFHFYMNNDNFIALNDNAKVKFFNMNEQQLKQNLFTFVEALENKFTGRFFQITLDGGRYPTEEDVVKGQDLCIENVKKFVPGLKLVSETTIMPNNIRNCVWQRGDGSLFSQYYMAKNSYMFCVAGDISAQHDDMDNLMASVCMSVRAETKEDLEKENLQKIMQLITEEANRLVADGLSMDEAMDKAFEKYGVNK